VSLDLVSLVSRLQRPALSRSLPATPKLAEKLFSDPDEAADPPFGFTQLTSRFGEGLLAFRSEDSVLVQRTLERRRRRRPERSIAEAGGRSPFC
jgi:hypothetical protein